jgi:hypothetical protein
MRALIPIFILIFSSASGFESPYKVQPDYNRIVRGSTIEVNNMPAVRDQDGIGICYAFSSTILLEQLNCKIKGIRKCTGSNRKISVLDVAQNEHHERGLHESGHAHRLLSNIETSDRRLILEHCAPFHSLLTNVRGRRREKNGWKLLDDIYQKKGSINAQQCLNDIKQLLPYIPTSIEQIQLAITNPELSFFRSEMLIPYECRDSASIMLPEFKVKKLNHHKSTTTKTVLSKIISVLKSQTPIIINFHSSQDKKTGKMRSHSAVISGIRKVCHRLSSLTNPKNCRYQVKLQNSYGTRWQQRRGGGWIDAKTIINKAISKKWNMLTWIEPTKQALQQKKPKRRYGSSTLWKCNGVITNVFIDVNRCKPL